MSQVTEQVINDIKARELKGLETYGVTMDRDDLTQDEWLVHAYEEALDFALYLRKLIIIRNGNIKTT
jgi:hypothetical protein